MALAVLTALESSYINPTSLACVFEGTTAPTSITWKKGANTITDSSCEYCRESRGKESFSGFTLNYYSTDY